MLTLTMYEVTTSMTNKKPKSEQVEPSGATRQDTTLPIALPLIPDVKKAIASAVLSFEVLGVTHMMIGKSGTPAYQLVGAVYA